MGLHICGFESHPLLQIIHTVLDIVMLKTLVMGPGDYRNEGHILSKIWAGVSVFSTPTHLDPNYLPDEYIEKFDLIVFFELGFKSQEVASRAKELGIPVIVVGLGYVDRAFSGFQVNKYFQVGLDSLNWIPKARTNSVRLYKRVKWLGPKQTRDTQRLKPILLATQKPGDWVHGMNEAGIKRWATEQVKEIRKYTDRPIVLKQHPLHRGKLEVPGTENDRPFNTEYWLFHCHCLVTHSSTVGIQAVALALPIYCHESAPYWEISMKGDYSKIEEAEAPTVWHRRQFMARVCYAQWTGDEIATGTPFLNLLDIRQGLIPRTWNPDYSNRYADIPFDKFKAAMSLETFNERRRAVKALCDTYLLRKWVMASQKDLEDLERRVYMANRFHKPRGLVDAYEGADPEKDGRKKYVRKPNKGKRRGRIRTIKKRRPRKS